nr:hypothetical protein [Tanacetum cinerariifolium]
NRENILKSIAECPFKMGKFKEALAKGALHLGSELMKDEHESPLYDDFEHFRQNKGETIHEYYVRVVDQNVQGRQNRGYIARECTHPKRSQNSEYFKDKMLLMQAQENGVVLDEEKLLFILGGQTTTFDDDVNEAPATQCVSANEQNKVVNESLTTELARYKEQVEIYEKGAMFELTEREQKIDKQLRIIIIDRNYKEESSKKEIHSVKMQLNSTINHNKSMVEEVTTLKKDFKKKENKYRKAFLDMKAIKEKVEDKLFKQDQSLQTVHMLCKPKPYYDEKKK